MSTETKTVKTRSVVEGPDFHCGPHNFKTADIEVWQQHLGGTEHSEFGHKPCMICNTRVHYTDNIAGHNVVCDNCLEGVIGYQVARKEREAKKLQKVEETGKIETTTEQVAVQQEEHKPSGEVQPSNDNKKVRGRK